MTELTPKQVRKVSLHLRLYAEHFVQSDWNYTRRHDIVHIRHKDDYKGYHHPLARLRRGFKVVFGPLSDLDKALEIKRTPRYRWKLLREYTKTESHVPDGVLDGGAIITHWEETGEYLQYVQPSVGSLIADFLDQHPEHPSAIAIAAEMRRIEKSYSKRIANGEAVISGQVG